MSSHKIVTVSKNGPYIVSGSVSLRLETIGVNAAGESTEWVEGNAFPRSVQYALCRCGNSNKKPFCDSTHAKIDFDGAETATRKPVKEQAQVLEGPSMQLADVEVLCAFARPGLE
jgi:CDGSH-type Zn-finger protein